MNKLVQYLLHVTLLALIIAVGVWLADEMHDAREADYYQGQVLITCLEHEGPRTYGALVLLIEYMADDTGMLTQGELEEVMELAGKLISEEGAP